MSEKDLIEKIPNWEYTYLYEGSRSFGKSYTQHLLNEKDKEIERLNSIINELEKWLEEKQMITGINHQGFSWGVAGDCLDKLKELKEKKWK